MTAAQRDPQDFNVLVNAYNDLSEDKPAFAAARAGILASMNEWIAPFEAADFPADPALVAFGRMSPSYIAGAVSGTGPEVLSRLYRACRSRASEIVIADPIRNGLNTPVLEQLVQDGYCYCPTASDAAEDWLSRGPHLGKDTFRSFHPRKSPVIAFWENEGLVLPKRGIHPEGRKLMAKEVERLSERRLPQSIEDSLRNRQRFDWRVMLCMLLKDVGLPFIMHRNHLDSLFGPERYAKLRTIIIPEDSAHGRMSSLFKRRAMPTVDEILGMPSEASVLDPYLGLA